jgi:hypothetical protein
MKSATLVLSAVLLSACGLGALQRAGDAACPAVRPYEQGFREALAAAMEAMPSGSPVRAAMADYWALRADAIACDAGR